METDICGGTSIPEKATFRIKVNQTREHNKGFVTSMRARHTYGDGYRVQKFPIDIDLQYDLQELCYHRLIDAGISNVIFDRAVYQYFNLRRRQVEARPRKIYKSDVFECPEEYERALECFEYYVQSGRNLLPFMSERVTIASERDDLFNALGIWHFHLSRRPGRKGFVSRSRFLILAVVTDDAVYMLKVDRHDHAWMYDRSLNDIIERNWPELLEKSVLKGFTAVDKIPNDDEYIQLRKAHSNTIYQLDDGKLIMGREFGVSSDGSALLDVIASDRWWDICGSAELEIRSSGKQLYGMFKKATSEETQSLHLRMLWIDDNEVVMIESESKLILRYPLRRGGVITLHSPELLFIKGRENGDRHGERRVKLI